jgi:hypothetical protein
MLGRGARELAETTLDGLDFTAGVTGFPLVALGAGLGVRFAVLSKSR